jgi:superfamily II DNA/RNA helicase
MNDAWLHVFVLATEQEEQLRSFKPDRVFRDSSAAQSISHEPYRRSRQIVFCSATIPQRKYFAQLCHRNGWSETVPALINVSEDLPMPATIEHEIILCGIDQRIQLTAHLLKEHVRNLSSSEQQQQPHHQPQPPKCIVFVDKEEKMPGYAEFLRHSLRKAAAPAPAPSFPASTLFPGNEDDDSIFAILSNDMNIEARRKALEAFKYSNASVLLSGGLATRGLDIPATSLVIQVSGVLSASLILCANSLSLFAYL